ncbi:MFS transporter [Marasmius fiardii PR-910]|nr:MFS transporter [Marasmius fiardii PR-910]
MAVQSEYEHQMTRNVLWKLDIHILPTLALLWLANFIDRSNIGNARIAGLEADTKLQGNQFNIILAVFYASYLVIELPSNWILKRMGANRWLPLIVVTWGIVTTLTGLVQSFAGVAAIRIFLGFCEGGLLPGIILYLSTMYKRHELQLRVGIFYSFGTTSPLIIKILGLLATAIIKMDGVGNLAGWRWIFILEGIVTVIIGVAAAITLPGSLENATFFSEEERVFAVTRFRADHSSTTVTGGLKDMASPGFSDDKHDEEQVDDRSQGRTPAPMTQEEEAFEWREVRRGLTDIQTWVTGIAYFGLIVSLYSYSLFLPTIIAGLGYSGAQAQLRTVPPYVPAAVLTVMVALMSDRLQWRGPFILICLPVAIVGASSHHQTYQNPISCLSDFSDVGYIVIIVAKTNEARYAAVFLIAAGVYPSGPCILSILPNNSSGHYKKATTTALQLAVANCGGFVATFAYTRDQSPRYIKGHGLALAFLCLAWILILINVLYCTWENKARAEGRRAQNLVKYQELWESGKTRAPIGSDRHPDFRFTL